jgi:hypothetical protein
LQRIVVINGKPSCDAQGMVSLIRQAGHSISGTVSATDGAKITGKRGDNGDEMTVEWGPADAERARLGGDTYKKFPADMYWARAVSQLGRRLFADVLLSVSYVPEEADAIPANGNANTGDVHTVSTHVAMSPDSFAAAIGERKVRQPPGTAPADDKVVDAEIVDDPALTAGLDDARKRNFFRLIGVKGIEDRDERLAYCRQVTGRKDIGSWNDLTPAEADQIIAQLKLDTGEEPPLQEETA